MARFRYRMQSILNIKAKLEEQAKQEFAMAQSELNAELEKLQQLCDRKQGYLEEGIRLREKSLNVRDILDNKTAIEQMEEYIKTQKLQVAVAQKNVDAAARKMMEARTQTKTYEKLREHEFEQFMKEENRKESKEIDERNSYQYAIDDDNGENKK